MLVIVCRAFSRSLLPRARTAVSFAMVGNLALAKAFELSPRLSSESVRSVQSFFFNSLKFFSAPDLESPPR